MVITLFVAPFELHAPIPVALQTGSGRSASRFMLPVLKWWSLHARFHTPNRRLLLISLSLTSITGGWWIFFICWSHRLVSSEMGVSMCLILCRSGTHFVI